MAKNTESINRSLFELLRSRGYAPTLLDTSGKEIPVPEEAEVFQFKFTKDGEEYGTVTASIDGLHKLVIYFGDDVAGSEKEDNGGDDSWYKLLNHLKRFAQQHQLSFEVKNRDHLKYDMAKREHMKKQERISEGYHPMGKKASYNDNIPTVKIVIEHSRQIEEGEQRYRNVNRIFLENAQGERILAPTTKPGVAQIYARHLAEGGLPHDDRWNHIVGLCEEYNKMGAFVRATRNGQFNESAQQLVNEGINHYQSLRESLSKMRGSRGYNSYFESYTPPLMEDDSEENNLNELFVQETLDPRIESVMPILSKLHKKVAEMKEVNELSEWADSLTEAPGAETLKHNDDTEKNNLKAFDLAEDEDLDEPAIDELDESDTQSSNPGGIPEEDLDEGILDTVKKVGSKVFDKLGGGSEEDLIKDLQKKAGVKVTGKKPEPKEKSVDEALDDAERADQKINTPAVQRKEKGDDWKVTKQDLDKADEKNMTSSAGMAALKKRMSNIEEAELEESGLQAYLGNKKYGKDGMDALRKAGREHASKEKMAQVRAKYDKLDEQPLDELDKGTISNYVNKAVDDLADRSHDTGVQKGARVAGQALAGGKGDAGRFEKDGKIANRKVGISRAISRLEEDDEFAGDYATGEAGQWRNKGPKANKPATIGDLVGEGEEKKENGNIEPWKHVSPRVNKPKIRGTDNYAKSGYYPASKPPVKKLDKPLANETVAEGSEDLARILNIAGIKK